MADPASPEEWLRLSAQHEQMATFALTQRDMGNQAHFNAGLAIECALKAYLMRAERLNGWPSRASRPDLYTHDLRKLMMLAGLHIDASHPIAAAWILTQNWDRNQGYDPRPMPDRVAKSWFAAAFGPEGVVTWLRANLP